VADTGGRRLTHVTEAGAVRMVDVGEKPATRREATATGRLRAGREALNLIREGTAPKGDVLAAARIAAILAAKRTADWIPLCHPLPLSGTDVAIAVGEDAVDVTVTVRTTGPTGVEMEALTAVAAGLLTVYDMLKAVDRGMVLGEIRLLQKSGGRSGRYRRQDS